MKKILSVFIVSLVAGSMAFGHCGSCGAGEESHADHGAHGAVGCSDKALLKYLKIQDSLASDDLAAAQSVAKELQLAGQACSIEGKECCLEMEAAAKGISEAKDIAAARASFFDLSNHLIAQIENKGLAHGEVIKMHCPMAMGGKGASWIQDNAKVRNPYYGASMLSCGMAQASIGEAVADAGCADGGSCSADGACCAAKKTDS